MLQPEQTTVSSLNLPLSLFSGHSTYVVLPLSGKCVLATFIYIISTRIISSVKFCQTHLSHSQRSFTETCTSTFHLLPICQWPFTSSQTLNTEVFLSRPSRDHVCPIHCFISSVSLQCELHNGKQFCLLFADVILEKSAWYMTGIQ